jgi:chemotaxis signal transduction protein
MSELTPRILARRRFFAQPTPPGYAAEMAAMLAPLIPEQTTHQASMLEFRIADLPLALASRFVKSIGTPLTVCPLPHRNNTAFLGLVAFAGEIIPCVSLARILGAADAITASEPRSVVLEERPGERWAFRVDAVLGISTGTIHNRDDRTEARLPKEWSFSLFEDEKGQFVDVLRPETLFQRLQRAIA